jgi:hypothetical protein
MTIFLCGLWLPVWIMASIRIGGYRCEICGYRGNPLVRFGVPLLCIALFFGSCALILPNVDLPDPGEDMPGSRRSSGTITTVNTGTSIIKYEIRDEGEREGQRKYDVEVDLVDGRLPTKAELGAISRQLRSSRHRKTLVNFYLPGMSTSGGAYATAHHDPGMTVRILNIPPKYRDLEEGKIVQVQPDPASTTNVQPGPGPVEDPDSPNAPEPVCLFDVPSLCAKTVDEIVSDLGSPTDRNDPYSMRKRQLAETEAVIRYENNGTNLMVYYDTGTGRVHEFFLEGSDQQDLLVVGKLEETDAAYQVEFVRDVDDPSAVQGVRVFPAGIPPPDEGYRIWTNVTGEFRREARFEGCDSGKVTLKRKEDGKIITVPLEQLSAEDQEWIRERQR